MTAPSLDAQARATSLVARDLSKAYGDHVVLAGVDLTATPGVPVGVVGENGSGKSTLLRLLAGVEEADTGDVLRPVELGHLPQDPTFPGGATVGDVLDEALAPLHDAAGRLEQLAAVLASGADASHTDEYAAHLDWCVLHDVWDADRRTEVAAARLGLAALDRTRSVATLSGGERSRLALAALVVRRPACLLLDEPTNHLDDDAMAFLEELIGTLPGVVVAASHDRRFLQYVCRQIVDLDPTWSSDFHGRSSSSRPLVATRFTGGYDDYLAAKAEARRRWVEAHAAQRAELSALRAAAVTTARRVAPNRAPRDNDKFIHHAKGENVARTVSRRVRDVERRIEVLEESRVPKPPRPLRFDGALGTAPTPGKRVVLVRDLQVSGRLDLEVLDLDAGAKMLVTGANGSGKSTLLRVLAGRVEPTSGTAQVTADRIGLLPQDVTFARPDRTPHDLHAAMTGAPVPLGELGLLHPRDLGRPVGVLSQGQQRRLALAVLVARAPDLLLLDEPTNHISLTLADELESAVGRSPGTVVVASHDRWLRARWNGQEIRLG